MKKTICLAVALVICVGCAGMPPPTENERLTAYHSSQVAEAVRKNYPADPWALFLLYATHANQVQVDAPMVLPPEIDWSDPAEAGAAVSMARQALIDAAKRKEKQR